MGNLVIKDFYDTDTGTFTYVVSSLDTGDAIIIDPVLDYDPAACKIAHKGIDEVVLYIKENKFIPLYALETHAHADHLTSSHYLKSVFPQIKVAIGAKITEVQKVFKQIYELDEKFKNDGSQFDKLIQDFERFKIGNIEIYAIPTPGHTPACMSYLLEDNLFCGDALFIEDSGTGRCDFPGGSAEVLYDSVHENLYNLSDETKVFVGHDYGQGGRAPRFQTTIGISKKENIQLKNETTKEEYVKFRNGRDQTLKAPRLLFQSLQVNIRAGELPKFFKMPVY